MKLYILLNPVAGDGQAKHTYVKLKKLLLTKNILYQTKISQYPKNLISLAKKAADKINTENEILLVIGGDGSMNEVLNGVKASSHSDLPIAYLPAGSGNDFARAAHITKDPTIFLSHLLNNPKIIKADCGFYRNNLSENTNAFFINNLGIGFDAYVVYQSNHQKLKAKLNKLHLGNLIYGINVVDILRKQDTFTVTVIKDHQKFSFHDVYFTTTTNHPYFGGGIAILPKATINSRVLDTIIVQKPNLRKFILLFGKLLKDGSHVNDPHFHCIEGKKIRIITTKPEYAQIDGEDHKKHLFDLTFEISSFNLIM